MRLIYALGGGLGHATRACQLAADLNTLGHKTQVLLPAAKRWLADRLEVASAPVAPTNDRQHLRRQVLQTLMRTGAVELIVDALPNGVLDELRPLPAALSCTALLRCHRAIQAGALTEHLRQFTRCVDLEPQLHWRPPDIHASALGPVARVLPAGVPCDVALVGSDPHLARFMVRLAARLQWAGVDVKLVQSHVDAPAPPLPQARVVVGPAGYNLTYELARTRRWHVAIPRPRAHDDQYSRAAAVAHVAKSPKDCQTLVEQLLYEAQPRAHLQVFAPDTLAEHLLREPVTA